MNPAEELPEVGELPSPLALEPGETTTGEVRHYRTKGLSIPLCPIESVEGIKFAGKWADVSCNECFALKPKRGRKKAEEAEKPKEEAKKAPEADPELTSMLPSLVARGINLGLFLNQRAPAPPEPLAMFSFNVVQALEHYNLLAYTDHPLAGLALSGIILAIAVKDSPVIENEEKLRELHGMTDVQS